MKKLLICFSLFVSSDGECMKMCTEYSDVEIANAEDGASCVPCALCLDDSGTEEVCCKGGNYKNYVLSLGTTAASLTFVGVVLALLKDTFFSRDECSEAVGMFGETCMSSLEQLVGTGVSLFKGQCSMGNFSEVAFHTEIANTTAKTCLDLCNSVVSKCSTKGWDVAALACSIGTVATTTMATALHWFSAVARPINKKETEMRKK